jgi:uncharacterized membrane protein SpoIIM required for sporulation
MMWIIKRKNAFTCFVVFVLAIPLGVAISLLTPSLATLYASLVEGRVLSTMGATPGIPLEFKEVLVIVANNLIPVVVGFSFPLIIASYNLNYAEGHPEKYPKGARSSGWKIMAKFDGRLASELYFGLSSLSLVLSFAFGFFVFGVFSGHLLLSGGSVLLWKGIRGIIPHAPFEVAAILMSASVGLGVRDALLKSQRDRAVPATILKQRLWRIITSKGMAISLGLTVLLVIVGALMEVYVSAPFARGV